MTSGAKTIDLRSNLREKRYRGMKRAIQCFFLIPPSQGWNFISLWECPGTPNLFAARRRPIYLTAPQEPGGARLPTYTSNTTVECSALLTTNPVAPFQNPPAFYSVLLASPVRYGVPFQTMAPLPGPPCHITQYHLRVSKTYPAPHCRVRASGRPFIIPHWRPSQRIRRSIHYYWRPSRTFNQNPPNDGAPSMGHSTSPLVSPTTPPQNVSGAPLKTLTRKCSIQYP